MLLRPYVKLDSSLLLTALLIHDFGEIVRSPKGEDTLWHNKTCEFDREEYEAFSENFQDCHPEILHEYQKAFLLQYSEKDTSCFSEQAQAMIGDLRRNNPNEIIAFRALEYWEYILYALANYEEAQSPLLLLKVLTDHLEALDDIAGRLPGFKEEIWTPEVREWCVDLMETNPGLLRTVEEKMYL